MQERLITNPDYLSAIEWAYFFGVITDEQRNELLSPA